MFIRQDHFRLVNALGEWAYQSKHIPGSMHFATMRDALHSLNTEHEIVIYCSDASCIANAALGQLLERTSYAHTALRGWLPGVGAGGLSLRGRVGQEAEGIMT
jgi:hypothetical protein